MSNQMKFFVSCILVTLLLGAVCASEPDDVGRIVGGQVMHISKAPYNVQLRRVGGGTFCGGALIASQYVLTAAHCLPGMTVNNLVVVAGANLMSDAGVQRRVVRITVHPEYKKKTMHSDAAILKLERPMSGKYINAVKVCSRPVRARDTLVVTGWGSTYDEGRMSNQMRIVTFPVATRESCSREFGSLVQKNMFCGSGFEAKGHCFGDSGGPALVNGELCGLNSFGYKCGSPGYQSAFTDVYAINSFIQQATRN